MHKMAWGNEYSLNIMEIDVQHVRFVELINEAREMLDRKPTEADIVKVFDGLARYAHDHFGTEEKYFELFHYPDAAGHIEQHEEAKRKIIEFKKQYDAEKSPKILSKLLGFMEDWLTDHIMKYDNRYRECFKSHGLK